MKKWISVMIAAVMTASMTVPAMAGISFSDMSANDWYYKPVMNMVNKGVIAGTTTPVNGVGTFSPDNPMTRAQFITVVVRYVYPNELATQPKAEGAAWYQANYDVAVDMGLINEYEFNYSDDVMNKPMTRQEMAMVLVRAMEALGEDTSAKVPESRIPDFYDKKDKNGKIEKGVGSYYGDYVRIAYKAGLIAGTDSAGTFNPHGTLTRAQAATVLNRLIDASTRTPASDVAPVAPEKEEIGVTGTSWYEGSQHGIPKAGDTVIKPDGTKVVLKATTINGRNILGYGQSVDFVTGLTINGITATEDRLGGAWKGYGDQGAWVKDPQSGEVHLENEWAAICAANRPAYNGTKDGETAGTRDGVLKGDYYKWDARIGTWYWIGP